MEGEYIFVDTDGIPICMTCDNSQKLLDDAHAEFAAIQHQYNAILLSNKELTRALCDASVQNNLKTTIIDVAQPNVSQTEAVSDLTTIKSLQDENIVLRKQFWSSISERHFQDIKIRELNEEIKYLKTERDGSKELARLNTQLESMKNQFIAIELDIVVNERVQINNTTYNCMPMD